MTAGGLPESLVAFLLVFLLTYAIHSTVLMGGVWILDRCRALSPSWRDTLWKTALLGAIVTAAVSASGWNASWTGAIPIPLTAPSVLVVPDGADVRPALWPVFLVGLWALGACLGVTRLAARQRRFVRSLGPRRPVMGPGAAQLRALRQAAGLRHSIRLTAAPHLEGPAALSRDEICLPERALRELDSGELTSVLAHELGHVARRDTAWRTGGALLACVFFFQPLHRVARRGLAEAAEFLADDWAVERTREEVPLARCLALVAGWLRDGARPALVAEMGTRGSPLVRRVERLLGDRTSLREAPRARRRGAVLLALLAVALLAPGVTPRPQPDPPRALFVPAAFVTPIPGHQELEHQLEMLHRLQVRMLQERARWNPEEQQRLREAWLRIRRELLRERPGSVAPAPAPRTRTVIYIRSGAVAWS